jgi:hypothetical protein
LLRDDGSTNAQDVQAMKRMESFEDADVVVPIEWNIDALHLDPQSLAAASQLRTDTPVLDRKLQSEKSNE